MKASELIKQIQEVIDIKGDLEVIITEDMDSYIFNGVTSTSDNIYIEIR